MGVTLNRLRSKAKSARNGKIAAGHAKIRIRPTPLTRLAGDIWASMVQAVFARKDRMAAVASKFDLTLPQVHLLRLLRFGPARTMTSIADALACDASNVTGIVDRLETRRLIERGNAEHDRRIKTITLTKHGKDVLAELTAGFMEAPKELRDLPEAHLRKLHTLVGRVFGHAPDESS